MYLFSGAKSFRGAKDKELIKFNCDYAKLKLDFFANGREQTAEINIKDRKTVQLNGIKKKSAAELGDEIKTIIFSPDHLNMIKEGPNERRKFVDGALCQIKSNYRTLLKNYNRTLVQRNTLLRNVESVEAITPMLEVWDVNLSNLVQRYECGVPKRYTGLIFLSKLYYLFCVLYVFRVCVIVLLYISLLNKVLRKKNHCA